MWAKAWEDEHSRRNSGRSQILEGLNTRPRNPAFILHIMCTVGKIGRWRPEKCKRLSERKEERVVFDNKLDLFHTQLSQGLFCFEQCWRITLESDDDGP